MRYSIILKNESSRSDQIRVGINGRSASREEKGPLQVQFTTVEMSLHYTRSSLWQ